MPHAKNPNAVALGRLGGLKGGPVRAQKLSQEQRKAIALIGAMSRWAKRNQRKVSGFDEEAT
jgi:hypothetical protein